MDPHHQEYMGHRIELRAPAARAIGAREADEAVAGDADPELIIDGVPVRYGRLPDGKYVLHEYAYDSRDDLMDLARRFIEYRVQ